MLKDNRARGLSQKYIGPFQIVKVMNGNYEIQSLRDNKFKVVNHNALKYYNVELQREEVNEPEHVLERESDDDSEFEDLLFEPVEQGEQPIRLVEDPEQIVRPYNLRRNRRAPERYGVPVYDY